jgi:F0F1-type ATP synthase membrane subunit c/vacuolar-type H+-ATPase subunit K
MDSVFIQFLHYYTSGFWVWAGITIGIAMVCSGIVSSIIAVATALQRRGR